MGAQHSTLTATRPPPRGKEMLLLAQDTLYTHLIPALEERLMPNDLLPVAHGKERVRARIIPVAEEIIFSTAKDTINC